MNTKLQYVSPVDIHWFQNAQADERRASFAKPAHPIDEFPSAYAENGHDTGQGVVKAYKLKPAEQAQAVKERQALVASWERRKNDAATVVPTVGNAEHVTLIVPDDGSPVTVSYTDLAQFARKIWTNKAGKWLKPTYGGNCCFRRGMAAPASMLAWLTYDRTRKPADFLFPVELHEYATDRDRLVERLAENVQRGRATYQPSDLLGAAVSLVKFGDNEATVSRLLNVKRGVGQKLYGWAQLVNKFPRSQLLDRFSRPRPETKDNQPPAYQPQGWLPFSAVNAGHARTLLGTAKKPDETAAAFVSGSSATADELESFLSAVMAGQTNRPAVMDKKTIETLRSQLDTSNAVDNVIHIVFTAVLTNDAAGIVQLRETATAADRAAARKGNRKGTDSRKASRARK